MTKRITDRLDCLTLGTPDPDKRIFEDYESEQTRQRLIESMADLVEMFITVIPIELETPIEQSLFVLNLFQRAKLNLWRKRDSTAALRFEQINDEFTPEQLREFKNSRVRELKENVRRLERMLDALEKERERGGNPEPIN